ncbi:Lipoate-protein ligase A subunit 1 [uncultured archaeon]|nr:Lipoate-protein ligase A subunit 1 [uncultured archaeon]
MKFRLISKDYPEDPYTNIALDEAIFTEVMKGRSPPTFRFYRNANAVILGCFQTAEEEVDMEYADANSIKVVKRITGGGAVYHDLGNLNYSIVAKDSFKIGLDVQKLFSTMMSGAVRAFADIGMNAEMGRLNDVSVGGKKILGAAATIDSGALLFHAAVLVDTDLNRLASVLKIPGIKLKDKGIKTVLERVTNIKAVSGKGVEEVRKALLDGYAESMGFEYYEGGLTDSETALLKDLYDRKFSRPEWNMGREIIEVGRR